MHRRSVVLHCVVLMSLTLEHDDYSFVSFVTCWNCQSQVFSSVVVVDLCFSYFSIVNCFVKLLVFLIEVIHISYFESVIDDYIIWIFLLVEGHTVVFNCHTHFVWTLVENCLFDNYTIYLYSYFELLLIIHT